jgi:hypothetical protein
MQQEDISIEIWNQQIVRLMQAMLGAISPNFRMITIGYENNEFVLKFFLEVANSEDFDEVDDIGFEFIGLQSDAKFGYKQEIIVTKERLEWPEFPTRTVYKRREL